MSSLREFRLAKQQQRTPLRSRALWSLMALGVGLVLGCLQGEGAASESVEPLAFATARAIAYRAIADGAELDVMAANNSELATESADRVALILKQKGFEIRRAAPLAVDVDAVLVRGIRQDQGPAPAQGAQQGPVRGDQYAITGQSPADDPLTRGNIFSSEHGALLSPARPHGDGHLLRVSISVYDRQSGRYVWRGSAQRETPQVSVESSLQQMILALLNRFGENLPETTVPLY
jgi:hypothetical protein